MTNLEEKVIENLIAKFTSTEELDDLAVAHAIEREVLLLGANEDITNRQRLALCQDIFNTMRGYDVLQPFLEDDSITEIMVNGFDSIYIEQKGTIFKTDCRFSKVERLRRVIQSIASEVNRKVDFSNPILDARLNDGSRVNIVLDPVALNGPILTIRKFRHTPYTLSELCRMGSFPEMALPFIESLVKGRYNILISGGTGSGKTTFLNALGNCIPDGERIITIEDSAEIVISNNPHVISLETRPKNVEGKGAIPMSQLIKTSLRMRPDRIVVGEVRGGEAVDMLQAMNTGHDGSISTGHSNSAREMLDRLETMILSSHRLSSEMIRRQIVSGIDIIIHLERERNGLRRVVEISEVLDLVDGEIVLNELYTLSFTGKDKPGVLIQKGRLKRVEKMQKSGSFGGGQNGERL